MPLILILCLSLVRLARANGNAPFPPLLEIAMKIFFTSFAVTLVVIVAIMVAAHHGRLAAGTSDPSNLTASSGETDARRGTADDPNNHSSAAVQTRTASQGAMDSMPDPSGTSPQDIADRKKDDEENAKAAREADAANSSRG
jgi:hypothetical protein